MPGGSIAPYAGNAYFFNHTSPPQYTSSTQDTSGPSLWDLATWGWNHTIGWAADQTVGRVFGVPQGMGGVSTGVAGGQIRVQAQPNQLLTSDMTNALGWPAQTQAIGALASGFGVDPLLAAAGQQGVRAGLLQLNPAVPYERKRSLPELWNQAGLPDTEGGSTIGQDLLSFPGFSLLTYKHAVLGIDPTDPTTRRLAFESGGFGEVASWGIDAVGQWFLDPAVLAGYTVKPIVAFSRGAALGVSRKATFELGAAFEGKPVYGTETALHQIGPTQLTHRSESEWADLVGRAPATQTDAALTAIGSHLRTANASTADIAREFTNWQQSAKVIGQKLPSGEVQRFEPYDPRLGRPARGGTDLTRLLNEAEPSLPGTFSGGPLDKAAGDQRVTALAEAARAKGLSIPTDTIRNFVNHWSQYVGGVGTWQHLADGDPRVADLLRLIDDAPTINDTLYKGIRDPETMGLDQLTKGEEFNLTPGSFSRDYTVAERFSGSNGMGAILRVVGPKQALNLSHGQVFSDLMAMGRFKFLRQVEGPGGMPIYEVEQVGAKKVPQVTATQGKRVLGVGPRQATVADMSRDIQAGVGPYGRAATSMFDLRNIPLYLMNHPVIQAAGDKVALATTLAGARTRDEFNTIMASALGDPVARAKLQSEYVTAAEALKAESSPQRWEEIVSQYPLDDITTELEEAIAQQNRVIAQMQDTNDYFARAVSNAEGPGVFGSLRRQGFSPFDAVNQARDQRALADAKAFGEREVVARAGGYWVTRRFKSIGGGWTGATAYWMGGKLPTGHIAVTGPKAALSTDEIMNAGRAANMPLDMINRHVNAFGRAVTPQARIAALEDFQRDALTVTIQRHFPEAIPGNKAYRDAVNMANEVLEIQGQQLAQRRGEIAKRGGFIHDQATREMVTISGYDPNLIPMIDYRELDNILAAKAGDRGGSIADLATRVPGVDRTAQLTAELMQMWKPLILLRVGAIPKNVGESWLASLMYLGFLPGNVIEGTKNFTLNRYAQWVVNNPLNPVRLGPRRSVRVLQAQATDIGANLRIAQREVDDALDNQAYLRTVDTSEMLPGQKYGIAAQRRAATMSVAASTAARDDFAAQLAAKQAQIGRMVETKATLRGYAAKPGVEGGTQRRVLGQKAVQVGELEGAGSAQGANVAEMMSALSAADKNHTLSMSYSMGKYKSERISSQVRNIARPVEINPEDPDYFAHMANFINTDIRQNPIAIRLMKGDNPADIRHWILTDPEGQALADSVPTMGNTAESVDAWIDNFNHNLQATFPNQLLQDAIVRGPVSPQQAAGYLAGMHQAGMLEPLMDDGLAKIPKGNTLAALNRFVDKLFDNFWTKPEDRLARWPLYHTLYTSSLKRDLARYQDHILGMSQEQGDKYIRDLERIAANQAQKDVTRIIYSAGSRTPIAEKLRWVSPFYQVTSNRMYYYGTQFLENPQNMARMFLGWNAISTTKDQSGKPVLTVMLPGFVRDHLPLGMADALKAYPGMQFNKSALNLINSGEPWYSPGWGPLVQVPMAEWLRQHPAETPQWVKTLIGDKGLGIFPNGYYGTDALDLVTPAWIRRWRSAEGQQGINTQAQLWTQEMMKYREGLRPDPPTPDEINRKSQGLWFFRIMSAFTLPAQPTMVTGRPDANIGDASNPRAEALSYMINKHSEYLKKYGRDGDNRFLNDFPEYYDYIISLSDNPTGVLPTDNTVKRVEQYGALANTLTDPKMASLVFNLSNEYGKFDTDAYNWEMNRPITPGSGTKLRGGLEDPIQGYKNRVIARGWAEYAKASQLRDSLMKMYGYSSIRQKDAAWVKAIFDSQVAQIERDTRWKDETGHWVTPWYDDYATQDNALYGHRIEDLRRIIDAPGYYQANIGQQPWLASAGAYIKLRGEMQTLLDQQKAAGGSNDINARSNVWIKTIWDYQRGMLASMDPEWAQIQATKFAHDDLSEIPLVNEQTTMEASA